MKIRYPFQSNLIAFAGILFAGALLFSSCKKDRIQQTVEEVTYLNFESVAILPSNEVNTTASGTLSAKFNTRTKELTYTITWESLTGEMGGFYLSKGDGATIDHFGQEDCPKTMNGVYSATTSLTQAVWVKDLKAGKLYAQINTAAYPGGELLFPFAVKRNTGYRSDDSHTCGHSSDFGSN